MSTISTLAKKDSPTFEQVRAHRAAMRAARTNPKFSIAELHARCFEINKSYINGEITFSDWKERRANIMSDRVNDNFTIEEFLAGQNIDSKEVTA